MSFSPYLLKAHFPVIRSCLPLEMFLIKLYKYSGGKRGASIFFTQVIVSKYMQDLS